MTNPLLLGQLGNGTYPKYLGNTGGLTIEEIIALLPPSAATGSFVVSGGGVTWTTGLSFIVAACSYYIQGVHYTSLQSTITLDTADATHPRIDVIGVNTSGVAFKRTGTAAADPSEPDIDPATELQLAFVLVDAGATTPTSVSQLKLYEENLGAAAEWNWTTSGSGFNVNSSTSPHAGTKVIAGTSVANGAYTQGQPGSGTIDIQNYASLVFYVQALSWGSNRMLTATWYNSGVKKGNTLVIQDGFWGFSTANLTDYQVIIIPTLQFGVPGATLVNQLRIAAAGTGGTFSFRIDDISLQSGAVQTIQGLTQAQADARYIRYI
jgi:hypothetical protein